VESEYASKKLGVGACRAAVAALKVPPQGAAAVAAVSTSASAPTGRDTKGPAVADSRLIEERLSGGSDDADANKSPPISRDTFLQPVLEYYSTVAEKERENNSGSLLNSGPNARFASAFYSAERSR